MLVYIAMKNVVSECIRMSHMCDLDHRDLRPQKHLGKKPPTMRLYLEQRALSLLIRQAATMPQQQWELVLPLWNLAGSSPTWWVALRRLPLLATRRHAISKLVPHIVTGHHWTPGARLCEPTLSDASSGMGMMRYSHDQCAARWTSPLL
jgi:hypothetical protein